MLTYLRDLKAEKDAIFAAIASHAGARNPLRAVALSFRGFPETSEVARSALFSSRKPPGNRFQAALKRTVYGSQYNWSRRYFERVGGVTMSWNGLTGSRLAFMMGAKHAEAGTLFVERAPFPGRITLDSKGVNQVSSLPRDARFYRDWAGNDPKRTGEGWRVMGDRLSARESRRADVGQAGSANLGDAPFVFCPLQVPDDTQITQFAGWVGSVEGMIDALATASAGLPAGHQIRIKEHPSSRIALGGHLARACERSGGRLIVDNQTDTFEQVAASRAVVTINSSVGLQAFFYDRPVLVLGQAFFRIPGLVTPVDSPSDLLDAMRNLPNLGFDADLRNAVMNYLDQVYYPRLDFNEDGTASIEAEITTHKLTQAQIDAPLATPLSSGGGIG